MSTRYRADHGLTRRMVLVMFLLGAIYVAAMGVVIVMTNNWVIPIAIALAFAVGQWYFSDKVALWALHAREVTPEQAPELHGMIDRLVALADMPKPRVAFADTMVPNAFATGRSQKNAVIVVTRGILDRLTAEELEGVLSHELSHVAHKDVAVMTIASFLGVLAGIVARYGMYAGMGRDSRDQNAAIVILVVWAVSLAVYALSFVLTRALSRYRELAADRAAAYLTGRPSDLASALVKLSDGMDSIPDKDLRKSQAMNAFAFAPALRSDKAHGVLALISTHPSTEKRLEQLANISAELGRRV